LPFLGGQFRFNRALAVLPYQRSQPPSRRSLPLLLKHFSEARSQRLNGGGKLVPATVK